MSIDTPMSLLTNNEIMLSIANKVVKERKVKDMSQKALAEHSNVPLGTLRNFEQNGAISLENLIQITRALVADQQRC
jgi:transcriptional regulator with XRE-family HTH domain